MHRNGKKLLLVYDQFEEALTAELTPDSKVILDLLRDVAANSVLNCRVLLSFRIDYFEWLTRIDFPPFGEGNHFTVEPFDADPARRFLGGGFERIGETLLKRVIDEATAYDDVTPRMRPITLNMVGLMLRQLPSGSRLAIGRRPFENHLRGMLIQGDVKQLGPTILHQLLDHRNQRVKLTVNQLAVLPEVAKQLKPKGNVDSVHACLTGLAAEKRGLVRCLNPNETEVGKREWEVSHDFVAALLGNILPGLLPSTRPSAFKVLRPWFAPASLLVWLASFFIALPYVQGRERAAMVARLSTEFGIRIIPGETPTARLDPNVKLTSLNGAIPLLKRLAVTELNAADCETLTEADLQGLINLQSLNLSQCWSLPSVDVRGLTALQTLDLRGCVKLDSLDVRG